MLGKPRWAFHRYHRRGGEVTSTTELKINNGHLHKSFDAAQWRRPKFLNPAKPIGFIADPD
jgi:hypothetical protein